YNVSRVSFAKREKWRPIAAFLYVTEDVLPDGAVDGINGFLQRYATCGLSNELDIVLPRRDAVIPTGCGHYPCEGQGLNLQQSDLIVQRGEFDNFVERLLDRTENIIEESTPLEERLAYFFVNVNCTQPNSRLYPDFCKEQFPNDTINKALDLLQKHLKVNVIWYT
ncbi:hypothetical protein AAVH_36599, partial [Aphelenchoides avenae]